MFESPRSFRKKKKKSMTELRTTVGSWLQNYFLVLRARNWVIKNFNYFKEQIKVTKREERE